MRIIASTPHTPLPQSIDEGGTSGTSGSGGGGGSGGSHQQKLAISDSVMEELAREIITAMPERIRAMEITEKAVSLSLAISSALAISLALAVSLALQVVKILSLD